MVIRQGGGQCSGGLGLGEGPGGGISGGHTPIALWAVGLLDVYGCYSCPFCS